MTKQYTDELKNHNSVIQSDMIDLVYTVRGKRVMLDRDIASMYKTETRIINQQLKRNIERFEEGIDYFTLSKDEFSDLGKILKSQNVISNWGGVRYPPKAFAPKGILLLATVLRSQAAHDVTRHIVNTFTETQNLLDEDIKLKDRIEYLERQASEQNEVIKTLYIIARELKG
jgi:hypothetical protein